MKKFLRIIPIILLCLLFASCGGEKKEEIFELPENYELAYADDFDELDTSVWRIVEFKPRKGGYWSPEQIKVEDGNLVITTEYKENGKQSGYYTGRLDWPAKRSTYGYYEIRCKVDDIRGAWSAFWLMPDDINNMEQKAQDGCEIDIFESAVPNKIQNTLHYDAYKTHKKQVTKVDDLYDGFHTFAVDWKKDSLKFYYDNKLLWEVTDPDLIAQAPVAMKISTEVGGNVKDDIAKPSRFFWLGCGIITDKNNTLPSEFVVDYVRVYDNGELVWSEYSE